MFLISDCSLIICNNPLCSPSISKYCRVYGYNYVFIYTNISPFSVRILFLLRYRLKYCLHVGLSCNHPVIINVVYHVACFRTNKTLQNIKSNTHKIIKPHSKVNESTRAKVAVIFAFFRFIAIFYLFFLHSCNNHKMSLFRKQVQFFLLL
jgi:hypothetical protein